jgi:bifunctional DNA-binding transcriptional regulator/antitoxin component of YhaV-PrlF toxin-antitoxin module
MIQSTQKIIKIGSSGGVTIPAKEMRRHGIEFGDEVDIIVRKKVATNTEDAKVIATARKILKDYQQDFKNLAKR